MNSLCKIHFLAGAVVLFLALAVGCGGDSGLPVYSSSTIYPDERNGRPVLVYEIMISDGDGNPYTKGLLVTGTAFTPGSVFPIIAANQRGQVTFVLEASTAGDYRVAIETFTDPKGREYQPQPANTDLNGKVLLTQTYDPSAGSAVPDPAFPTPAR